MTRKQWRDPKFMRKYYLKRKKENPNVGRPPRLGVFATPRSTYKRNGMQHFI